MADWVFYAVEITTGIVFTDLPLTGFSGEVSLAGPGAMSASLPLLHLDNPADRAEMIACTTPGRFSIAALRDGRIVGEWIIWQRTRKADLGPITLSGSELLSFANHRVMRKLAWTQTEQLEIARVLMSYAYAGTGLLGGAVAIDIPYPAPSGVKRDRDYKTLDGDIGARLKELSDVDNGFDYFITPIWSGEAGVGRVVRQVSFAYPRAGIDQPLVFEIAGPGISAGGNILDLAVVDDATGLASRCWAVGSSTANANLIGTYFDGALIDDLGYPGLEKSASYSTVIWQSTIDAYAKTLWLNSQQSTIPQTLTVLADTYPAIGDYGLGDRAALHLEASTNFPDGYDGQIRIVGWTFKPPDAGPETITLSISQEA